MSKYLGDIFGVEVRVSEFVPDGEVYVVNRKTLDSFSVTDVKPVTILEKVKKYFADLWRAIRGKS